MSPTYWLLGKKHCIKQLDTNEFLVFYNIALVGVKDIIVFIKMLTKQLF